ncbi:probable receptor-like serine/threonine-protein kinase At5g57670 isoform X2 [Aristolochia californica]|uniref:probable receptor-like serine/threonine-protein kinase At5g57670 isoform X2 n=1 Tax=Aristolochia californica TaxID=171875 RepID=UPI0035E053D5
MEEITVCSSANKIIVGVPFNAETSIELLSWAIGVAAQPSDTVIALHVLLDKDMTKMRQAKAFVISMLGEFADFSQSKKVNLEAKVVSSTSVGKGLVQEAAVLEANFLVIGDLKNQTQSSLEITKYCFNYAPEGCLVIAIRKRVQSPQNSDSESTRYEGHHQPNSTRSGKGTHIGKALTSMRKHFTAKAKRESSFSTSSSHGRTNAKDSPRSVLDGTEEGSQTVEEDCSSLGDSRISDSSPPPQKIDELIKFKSPSKKWKHLSVIKLIAPFPRSPFDRNLKDGAKNCSDKEKKQPSWRCVSYEEIAEATNNFHPDNIVGRGGYSEVYRGDLRDGQTIAVKRLAKDNTDETKQKEFLSELGIIVHVCHPNTSYLLGCCIEKGLHLIFNFSPNGNLASALHGEKAEWLEWPVRYKIAVGIARGLHYLHKRCKHRIIHRDIKASNILLGPEFEPQITDFGLAKWLPKRWTHHSVIPIEGTFGYLAPEYFMHGIVDEKTDVFAFGVLLLEIITGRRPIDCSKPGLLQWARPLMESRNIAELPDPRLGGKYDTNQMKILVTTASYCVRQSSIWRPSMVEVLQSFTEGCKSKVTESCRIHEYDDEQLDDYTTEIDFEYLTSPDLEEDY